MSRAVFRFFIVLAVACCFVSEVIGQTGNREEEVFSLLDGENGIALFNDQVSAGINMPDRGSLRKSLRAAERDGNTRLVAEMEGRLGIYYLGKHDAASAIPHFEKSLTACHGLNDRTGMALSAFWLGLANYKVGYPDKALQFLYNAIEISGEESLLRIKACAQGLAALLYLQKDDMPRSKSFVSAALASFDGVTDRPFAVTLLNRVAERLILKNDFRNATAFSGQCILLAAARKDAHGLAIAYRNRGIIDFKKSRFEAAIACFDTSMSYRKNFLVAKLKKDACLKLAAFYSFKNDFGNADRFHSSYRMLKDSLRIVEKSRKISGEAEEAERFEKEKIIGLLSEPEDPRSRMLSQKDLELSQQITPAEIERQGKEKALEDLNLTMIEKREREKELLRVSRQKALQDLELSQNQLELSRKSALANALIGGSVVFVLIIFFLYSRYRYKRIANNELNRSNRELTDALDKLKSTQEQLVYSQKMASLGELAAGIAHEIKNPLNFVNNFSAFSLDLLKELENSPEDQRSAVMADIHTNISKITEHGRRADQIVRNMQLLSRSSSKERQPVDIGKLVKSDLELAYSGYCASHPSFECIIDVQIAGDLPPVNAGIQDISRVLFNVLSNSFYAMHQRGKLEAGYAARLEVHALCREEMVVISLKDNGTGMPEEIRPRIFNPFFTTKPAGTGAGLGLSISYDIVKAHGGDMEVVSEETKQTEVIIRLPLGG